MTQDDLFLPLMGSPAAAGLARTLVSERLSKWHFQDIKDDALLVVSELVANASEAASGRELRLRLTRDAAGLLLQLWDPSPAAPQARAIRELTLTELDATTPESWNEGGGWGLPIVQALSADCGYRPTPPVGKWVWARLAR